MKRLLTVILMVTAVAFALGVGTASANLITNGDFESGNSGFTSNYLYFAKPATPANAYANPKASLYDEGTYGVGTNPGDYHALWADFGDHTSGSGNMMIVNGYTNAPPDAVVWTETITVTANTNYNFSLWAASLYPPNQAALSPATLIVSVGGSSISFDLSNTLTVGTWEQFSTMWNSGAATTAILSLVNTNSTVSGNDFALDDISMNAVPEPSTMLLLGSGLIGLAAYRMRRRNKA